MQSVQWPLHKTQRSVVISPFCRFKTSFTHGDGTERGNYTKPSINTFSLWGVCLTVHMMPTKVPRSASTSQTRASCGTTTLVLFQKKGGKKTKARVLWPKKISFAAIICLRESPASFIQHMHDGNNFDTKRHKFDIKSYLLWVKHFKPRPDAI